MRQLFPLMLVASPPANLLANSAPSDAAARTILSLNGKWAYIIDPYDTGYLDYRGVPYDRAANPTGGGFLNRVPASKSELVEDSFDDRSILNVPGDWTRSLKNSFIMKGRFGIGGYSTNRWPDQKIGILYNSRAQTTKPMFI